MEHYKLGMTLGDNAGAQNYAKLQAGTAANPTRSLAAMMTKLAD
jgi:hypothetical protein